MIAVKVMGGIGNQFFQYAFSKYVEKMTRKAVFLDLSYYNKRPDGDTARVLYLDRFQTDYKVTGAETCYHRLVHEEQGFSFGDDSYSESEDILFQGYWQDYRYIEYQMQNLQQSFTLKSSYVSPKIKHIATEMKKTISVSLHVRRTDYLNPINGGIFRELSIDYYREALRIIKGAVGIDQLIIYVFSDDMKWVVSELLPELNGNDTLIPVEGNDATQD